MTRRTFARISAAAPLAALSGSCSRSKDRLKLALNWKADPQFGGFYAADYAKHGLNVDLLPGGAGTPTVQMIGSRTADFGIVSADELILARARGNDVVALFAVFQNCPQGIMAHAERKLASIQGVTESGTLAIQRGLPYARILERRYGFEHVRVVPSPGGDITAFLNDINFAQQCFVMSEPLHARKRGAAVQVFPVGDIGYNPYTTVVATSGDNLRTDPSFARKLVDAVREGWKIYIQDPEPTNRKMMTLNPAMDMTTFSDVAKAQSLFIIGGDAGGGKNLGTMTADRWATLGRQLAELGDIPAAPKPEDCFRILS